MGSSIQLPRCTFVPCLHHLQTTCPPCYKSRCSFSIHQWDGKRLCLHPLCNWLVTAERKPAAMLCNSTVDRDFVDAINEVDITQQAYTYHKLLNLPKSSMA